MRMNRMTAICLACLVAMAGTITAETDLPRRVTDSRLAKATRWVQGSDEYLHQSKITRGMTGYGLTVMSGTEIVRFEVEIESVLSGYSPQRDLILARVKGQGLHTTGIIAGMSGSPVFINHEGKDKLIGAVAYGYAFQKSFKFGPLCGIQPISQMLAVADGPLEVKDGQAKAETAEAALAPAEITSARLPRSWREKAFATEKANFTLFGMASQPAGEASAAGMKPLTTPIMVGGLSEKTRAAMSDSLKALNATAVRSGKVGAGATAECDGLKLERGSAMAIPMVRGDEEMAAVGTVTEVVGDRVVGFGHPWLGDGLISAPLATAYVHTVVANANISFKMGAPVEVVGELTSDEFSAVGGRVGSKVDMIPVKIDVTWADTGQTMNYEYEILRERKLTTLLAMTISAESVWGTRNLPADHTVEYDVTIDFGSLGTFEVSNLSAAKDIYDVISDMTRPLALMVNNPFGQARVHSVEAKIRISPGVRQAQVLGVSADRNVYAPGDTVKAVVRMQRYKGSRFDRTIEVKLPADLPEGEYELNAGDWVMAARDRQKRQPRLFEPRNLAELLGSVQTIAEPRMDKLYAVVPVGTGGVAVDTDTVAEAPPTIAAMLTAARPLDVSEVGKALTAEAKMDFHVTGSATTTIAVRKHPPTR